jgi:hypothetical protein
MLLIVLAAGIAPAAALVPPGSIQIWSTPGGANACIDGSICQVTMSDGSATFDGLSGESYHMVTVSLAGYQTFAQSVYVSSQAISVVNAALQPNPPAVGSIQAYITPYGGTVCVDGGQCRVFSPVDLNSVASVQFTGLTANNYHTLTVSLNGYQPYTQNVYVTPGDIVQVNAVLQPVPTPMPVAPGSIQIWSNPGGAFACIDGSNCRTTLNDGSATFDGLTGNSYHTVTVSLPGYQPFTGNVLVMSWQTSVVNAALQPVPTPVPPVTTIPPTTKAGLTVPIALFATGICSAALLCRRKD